MIPRGIISSDGHICEPPNCYVTTLNRNTATQPAYRRPTGWFGGFCVPGMKRPVALGFIDGAGFSIKERNARAKTIKFSESVKLPTAERRVFPIWTRRDCRRSHLCLGRDGPMYAPRPRIQRRLYAGYNRWLQSMCSEARTVSWVWPRRQS